MNLEFWLWAESYGSSLMNTEGRWGRPFTLIPLSQTMIPGVRTSNSIHATLRDRFLVPILHECHVPHEVESEDPLPPGARLGHSNLQMDARSQD